MTQPGWHPDPEGVPNQLRWWDGRQWTSATHPVETNTDVEPPPEAGQPSPNRRRNNVIAASVLAVAAAGIVGSMALQGGDSEDRSSPVSSSTSAATSTPVTTSKAPETLRPSRNSLNSGIAEVACENAVKDRLKSPSTADFPDNNTRKNADGSFQVRGVVDSDNSFGATTRSYFGCTVIPAGIGQHRVTVDELFQP
ncbi:DUF2510 domain-containing protein [Rhodococcus hoagii]|uniref:DUF2510 domain-containing protein n=1 Tax=Rhodococcus hoagii TaxID=43767 RepID=A0A9Q2PKY0_RHOHA|nr:DUF2510 domain-containing protein [Prescottella equi]MBM4487374.1 DUF2510 domain-containing protein [Prescottella equi]MBM4489409.1 DUF2510 domain-containing protein [Prescottella equi]MBM4489424.1 DUF2510 domain-containing protein [Prescottella equi]MBM4516253.1 DUF2510 domain-containing protein [Prescottella equi]